MTTEQKLAIATQALKDVADPWERFKRDGHVGNTAHILLINCLDNPETYKQFARDALQAIAEKE